MKIQGERTFEEMGLSVQESHLVIRYSFKLKTRVMTKEVQFCR